MSVSPPPQGAKVFISYRREDSAGHAGRLYDRVSGYFGDRIKIFMDIDSIAPGEDFIHVIENAVGACEILVAVIGRDWLSVTDAAGKRRLDNPEDFVRVEIATALSRNIRVIPVLVQEAEMPRAEELPEPLARLSRRNAIEISDARWKYDAERLIKTIEDVLNLQQQQQQVQPPAVIDNIKPRRLVNGDVSNDEMPWYKTWRIVIPIIGLLLAGFGLPAIIYLLGDRAAQPVTHNSSNSRATTPATANSRTPTTTPTNANTNISRTDKTPTNANSGNNSAPSNTQPNSNNFFLNINRIRDIRPPIKKEPR